MNQDDIRDIAIRCVDEMVKQQIIPDSLKQTTAGAIWFDTEFEVQDIIHNKLIHNLADMDSPIIKEYIGE